MAWEFFSKLFFIHSKTTHYLQSYFFLAQCPVRSYKSACCGPFEDDHPRRYQNRFFNPQKVRWATCPFYLVVPPALHITGKQINWLKNRNVWKIDSFMKLQSIFPSIVSLQYLVCIFLQDLSSRLLYIHGNGFGINFVIFFPEILLPSC